MNDLPKRFWKKVDKNGPVPAHRPELGPCWMWRGFTNDRGYGIYNHRRVHQLTYNAFVGPIPEGLELDHLCRVRACCHPFHVEAVTHKENCQRGLARVVPGARNRAKTHCRRGHAYDKKNTYVNATTGKRICRACQCINQQNYLQRQTNDRTTA